MNNIKNILIFCGACISFYIGAGFATMQEVMQYEASYGSAFPIVIFVTALIYVYTNVSFVTNASRLRLKRGGDIYRVYCQVFGSKFGNILAVFFDYFSAFFCYMSFIVMCGGANATFIQQWGISNGIGAIVLTALVLITVIFGLSGIVNTLGKIGPLIIAMIILVSTSTAISGWNNFESNLLAIDLGQYRDLIKQIGEGNPIISGASYGGFVILWFASFLAELGSKNKKRQLNIAVLLSALFIFLTSSICCFALIANIDLIAGSDIPALILARQVSPCLDIIFAIIIYLGIYTSATPLLWTAVRKISNEGSKTYKILTVYSAAIGCLIACIVPYKGLINILYGINGYLGFILVFSMIFYDIKTSMSKNIKNKGIEV